MPILHLILIWLLLGSSSDRQILNADSGVDGDYQDAIPFSVGRDLAGGEIEGISALVVADLNGDGLPDVLTLEGGKHAGGRMTVGWLEAPANLTGQWQFHPLPKPQTLKSEPVTTPFIGSAQCSDIDLDGDIDIVLSADKHSGDISSASVYILQNPGKNAENPDQWGVVEMIRDQPWHHINDMVIANLDRTGSPEVIVRTLEPNQLVIFRREGAEHWNSRILDASPFGITGEGFAIGDIDKIGNPDVVIGGYWLATPKDILTGNFIAHPIDTVYKQVNANMKLDVGDINLDGFNDVVISPAEGYRNGGNYDLAWYEAPTSAKGKWTKHVVVSGYNGGHTVKLGDLNLDGYPDLLSGVCWNNWDQRKHISIFIFNPATGEYGPPQLIISDKGLYTGVVTDIDNDGDLDIIGQDEYSGHSRPYLYENRMR